MQLWFQEEIDATLRFGYLVKDVLFRGESEFQRVDVIDTEAYGRMLLIDGLVMITDKDEFVYHELIAHIPALHHPKPKHAVVIGGGDGGTVRELLKHPGIEKITLCEIDELVINASRQFFPEVAKGLDDPRVEVRVGDGVDYMKKHPAASLDIVIVDSTDPIGPGEGLFTGDFYRSVAAALKSDGLMVCQSESPWYEREILGRIHRNVGAGFSNIKPYIASVPTYPRGFWSWTLAANRSLDPSAYDKARLEQLMADDPNLRFINADMMTAVFALPNFYREKVASNRS